MNEYIKLVTENSNIIKIKEVASIVNKTNEKNVITVQKNSLSAGEVYLLPEAPKDESNNHYYFENIKKIKSKYLYYILKYNENNLSNLAKLTTTINLSRSNLENIDIQLVSDEIQDQIINQCDFYNNAINALKEINNVILNKEIIKQIQKIACL